MREGASVRVMSSAGSGRGSEPLPVRLSSVGRRCRAPTTRLMLRVLPSGPLPPNPGEMAASQRFGEIIGLLADTADLVIIDTPPLLEVGDTAAMASKADGVVFVVNMARVRWPMLERSHAQLEKFPCRKLGMVIVAAKRAHKAAYGYEYRYGTSPRGAPPPAGRLVTVPCSDVTGPRSADDLGDHGNVQPGRHPAEGHRQRAAAESRRLGAAHCR